MQHEYSATIAASTAVVLPSPPGSIATPHHHHCCHTDIHLVLSFLSLVHPARGVSCCVRCSLPERRTTTDCEVGWEKQASTVSRT